MNGFCFTEDKPFYCFPSIFTKETIFFLQSINRRVFVFARVRSSFSCPETRTQVPESGKTCTIPGVSSRNWRKNTDSKETCHNDSKRASQRGQGKMKMSKSRITYLNQKQKTSQSKQKCGYYHLHHHYLSR